MWLLKKVTVGSELSGETYKQLLTSVNKADLNVFNRACLSQNLAHRSSFCFSLRVTSAWKHWYAKEANSLWEHDCAPHTEISPSVTWHSSVCDLLIQNINREELGPIVEELQAEFSALPSKWMIPPLYNYHPFLCWAFFFSLTSIISLELRRKWEKCHTQTRFRLKKQTAQCLQCMIHNLAGEFLSSSSSFVPMNCLFPFFLCIIFSRNFVVL